MKLPPFPSDDLPGIEHIKEQIYDLFEDEYRKDSDLSILAFLTHVISLLDGANLELSENPGLLEAIENELVKIKQSLDGGSVNLRATVSIQKSPDDDFGEFELDEQGKVAIPNELGNFRDIQEIGSGSFGIVCSAINSRTGKKVALKFPQSNVIANNYLLQMFLKEADHVIKLDHPQIVKTHSVETIDGYLFIVQQLVDGGDLKKSLWQKRSHREIAELVAHIADAMAYAHGQRIVHRDLKPSNILLDPEGLPLISDFGMALDEDEQLGAPNSICGTIPYMAPEMVAGLASTLDGRADIWSIGVILYELLVFKRPFRGKSTDEIKAAIESNDPRPLRQIDRDIPKELQRICLKCLERAKRNRYLTADELATDLRSWIERPNIEAAAKSAFVPKGLRSYSREDSDFFLDLLPGPRDRDNMPASIRFWKSRVVEPIADEDRVPVGVVYGPSGSGKSSFMKAGLLPQLDEHVDVVYVESVQATKPDDSQTDSTENRLLEALRKRFPAAPKDASLREFFRGLSLGSWQVSDQKVLIVLDQFEQRLSQSDNYEQSQLAMALRHCDGKQLQCILLNRDDFHMSLTRFADALEMDLREGENSQAIDLFDRSNAKSVLAKLGQAYGRLPNNGSYSEDQLKFLETAVNELATGSYVVCVRLTLFAEMFKSRDWTMAELATVGGVRGVGEKFLDETFCGANASARLRSQALSVQAVLDDLLPDAESDIRGATKSSDQLMESSGLRGRRGEFAQLIRTLDDELRLITRTDASDSLNFLNDKSNANGDSRHYRLTHDYLVPSIRNWLDEKRNESPKLRTKSRFARLAKLWSTNQDKRYLPNVFEFGQFCRYISRKNSNAVEKEYFNQATKFYLFRGIAIGLVLISLGFGAWQFSQQHENELAKQYVARFVDGHPKAVPSNVLLMQQHKSLAVAELLSMRESDVDQAKSLRIDVGLAMLGQQDHQVLAELVSAAKSGIDLETQNVLAALRVSNGTEKALVTAYDELEDGDSAERARIAILMLCLGDGDTVSKWIEEETTDFKTLFVHTIPRLELGLKELLGETDLPLRNGSHSSTVDAVYCLSIGKLKQEGLVSLMVEEELVDRLQDCFEQSDHPYLTASSEWALKQFGIEREERAIDGSLKDLFSDGQKPRSIWVESLGFRMNLVPAGRVEMSASLAGVEHEMKSTIENDFFVADREVTVRDFNCFVNDESYNGPKPVGLMLNDDEDVSVTRISFIDAVMFCNWLSQKEGLEKCYSIGTVEYELGPGFKNNESFERLNPVPLDRWSLAKNDLGFCLPTYAEWDCYENGVDLEEFYFGREDTRILANEYCWNQSNSSDGNGKLSIRPTKHKIPNVHGLFDVYGNASEICWDFPFRKEDPNAYTLGFYTVERGGSFRTSIEGYQTNEWDSNPPFNRTSTSGMRLIIRVKKNSSGSSAASTRE